MVQAKRKPVFALASIAATGALCCGMAAMPALAYADESDAGQASSGQDVYRLYNPTTDEHLYTTDWNEACTLYTYYDWGYEGTSWTSSSEGVGVYRLYNGDLGNHLYTTDLNEVSVLTQNYGWQLDNNNTPLFYSSGECPVYRLYNESLGGMHHLTTDKNEYEVLADYGWSQEGISFYSQNVGEPYETTHYYPQDKYETDPVSPEMYCSGDPVASRAYSYIGKAVYVWGACEPGKFDCSGFVSYCLSGEYERLGTTLTFMTWPRVNNPMRGDVATSETHCGIYIGDGKMIHCAAEGVTITDVPSDMIYVRRYY